MDDQVEKLLRESRPEPDRRFVGSLEARLLGVHPGQRARAHRRPLFAGAGLATGLAGAALALSLAGVGPLASSDEHAQADMHCHFVTVTRREQVPMLVHQNGHTTLQLQTHTVERRVKRCS
jgi:hypothetical protein